MKFCPNCGTQVEDNTAFCPSCGKVVDPNAAAGSAANNNVNYNPSTNYNAGANYNAANTYAAPQSTERTFDAQEVSDKKLFAVVPYVFGVFGSILSALAAKDSEYVMFHIKQALTIDITTVLLGILTIALVWTFIVPIASSVCIFILLVVRIICICNVLAGKSKEAPILSSFKFFK